MRVCTALYDTSIHQQPRQPHEGSDSDGGGDPDDWLGHNDQGDWHNYGDDYAGDLGGWGDYDDGCYDDDS